MQTRATILCDLDCVALLADVHIHGAADGVAIRHVVLADVGLLHRQPHFPVALVVSLFQRWEEHGFKPFHAVYLLPFGLSACGVVVFAVVGLIIRHFHDVFKQAK